MDGIALFEARKRQGLRVERHKNHFSPDAVDAEGLLGIGQRGWFAISKVKRIRYRRIEREAHAAARVGLFVLTPGNRTGLEQTEVVAGHAGKLLHIAKTSDRPFLARITRRTVRLGWQPPRSRPLPDHLASFRMFRP